MVHHSPWWFARSDQSSSKDNLTSLKVSQANEVDEKEVQVEVPKKQVDEVSSEPDDLEDCSDGDSAAGQYGSMAGETASEILKVAQLAKAQREIEAKAVAQANLYEKVRRLWLLRKSIVEAALWRDGARLTECCVKIENVKVSRPLLKATGLGLLIKEKSGWKRMEIL